MACQLANIKKPCSFGTARCRRDFQESGGIDRAASSIRARNLGGYGGVGRKSKCSWTNHRRNGHSAVQNHFCPILFPIIFYLWPFHRLKSGISLIRSLHPSSRYDQTIGNASYVPCGGSIRPPFAIIRYVRRFRRQFMGWSFSLCVGLPSTLHEK